MATVNPMNELLLKSALYGDLKNLKKALEEGADINFTDKHGFNALLNAARGGSLECVEYLLKNKIDIKQRTSSGETPLLLAAHNGKLDIVVFLLKNHLADINELNNRKENALDIGSFQIQEYLFDYMERNFDKQDFNRELNRIFQNTKNSYHNFHLLALLLSKGASLNPNEQFNSSILKEASKLLKMGEKGWDGKDPHNLQDFLFNLKAFNIALNGRREEDGNTALLLAIQRNDKILVQALLNNGASIEIQNNAGVSPLNLAAKETKDTIVAPVIKTMILFEQLKRLAKVSEKSEKKDIKETEVSVEKPVEKDLQKIHPMVKLMMQVLECFELLTPEDQAPLRFQLGEMLSDPKSPVFNPLEAYKVLDEMQKDKKNAAQFQKANEILLNLLLQRLVIFKTAPKESASLVSKQGALDLDLDLESGEGELDLASMPAQISETKSEQNVNPESAEKLESIQPVAWTGQAIEEPKGEKEREIWAKERAALLRAEIKHLLLSGLKEEQATLLDKMVAEYALGAEHSMFGIKNYKGQDVESQLVLMDCLRQMQIENRKLKETIQAKDAIIEARDLEIQTLKHPQEQPSVPVGARSPQSAKSFQPMMNAQSELVRRKSKDKTNKPDSSGSQTPKSP